MITEICRSGLLCVCRAAMALRIVALISACSLSRQERLIIQNENFVAALLALLFLPILHAPVSSCTHPLHVLAYVQGKSGA